MSSLPHLQLVGRDRVSRHASTIFDPLTLGDPITIRIIDYDWSASEVYTLNSRQGDPLAMRLLSGTVKPAKGGTTNLVFSSDFAIPTLSKPE